MSSKYEPNNSVNERMNEGMNETMTIIESNRKNLLKRIRINDREKLTEVMKLGEVLEGRRDLEETVR